MNLNNIRNLKEFKALIERYESITLEEIKKTAAKIYKEADDYLMHFTARKLTGFGSTMTCTLCQKVDDACHLCVWQDDIGCNRFNYSGKTYSNIGHAANTEQLLAGFKARATFMREHLQKLGID